VSEKSFTKGDRVVWDTPPRKTTGRVVEKPTRDKRVGNPGQKGSKVSASEDDPRYVVESDKTGKRAAHRPEALERRGS
jgi:DUF2945 family protein